MSEVNRDNTLGLMNINEELLRAENTKLADAYFELGIKNDDLKAKYDRLLKRMHDFADRIGYFEACALRDALAEFE